MAAGCSSSTTVHVAKIGVVAPLDAGLVQFGRGIRNSVQVAVNEANQRKAVPGWRFVVGAANDGSDPAIGEAAAQRIAADPAVIGVVGTYNSGVAAKVAPVLNNAGIVMISPGNTDPALTLGPNPAQPVRTWPNYFRMVAADNVQAPFLAKYAFEEVKARKVAVVSETKPVSKGLADSFSAAYEERGGAVVFKQVVPDGTTDYGGVMKAIAPLKPDLLFFGGEYQVGAEFSKQAVAAGITVPVMGGDGLKDDSYITTAGPASDGDLASTVGAPLANQPSAKPFTDAYAKAGFAEPASDFGVYAYDAANVIIAAAVKPLKGSSKVSAATRAAIVAGVQHTDMGGASGRLAFDQYGDTQTKVLTLYQVSAGAWKPTKTETVS
jgi:branched-chain amino acid transport system substrate-binding protein